MRMRGKLWKSAAGVGMVLAMALGLCACGKDKNIHAGLAKEGVYSVQSLAIPKLDYDYTYVNNAVYRDGTIYLLMNAEIYPKDDGSGTLTEEYWSGTLVVSMKEDGSDTKVLQFEMPVSEPKTGTALPPGTVLPDSGKDAPSIGIDPRAAASATADAAANVAAEIPVSEDDQNDYSYTRENTRYDNHTIGPDGKIYAVRSYNYQYEDYNDPEASIYVSKSFLTCWSADGGYLWDKPLEALNAEEGTYYYIAAMTVTADGGLNLLLGGEKASTVSVDPQGNASDRKPLPESASKVFANNSFSAYPRADGSMLITYYGENWEKQYLATLNLATGAVEELGEMPGSLAYGAMNIRPGMQSDLVYRTQLGIYTYNAGDTEGKMKMSFINSDLNITNIQAVIELDEERFLAVYDENYGETAVGMFTRVDPKDVAEKSVLVLAGNYINSDIKQRVVEYNRSSDKYRITIKDYSTYNTYEDYTAGMTQLNTDIIAGNMPDIILTEGLQTEIYAAKGWLADIGKMIREDEELSKVEFLENVFEAYSMDGKLYYVIPQFYVMGMMGKASLVGDRTSWTMAEAMQLVNSTPGSTLLGADMTRSSFVETMMGFCGNDFVDVSTGKCSFDSKNFLEMMEYAKTLPETFEYKEDYWQDYDYTSLYRNNKVILMPMYFSSFSEISQGVNGMFGGDVSYIGFPTESGKGSMIMAPGCYVISERSSYKEGAWDFLRYYLTDEYQDATQRNFPVKKAKFMEMAQDATRRPYYINDETGEKVEYDNTIWINGEDVVVDPLSQEQLDKLLTFLLSVNKRYYVNDAVSNIVKEDIEAYFSGQKSAEEVAKLIQNRAQLYVNENR